MEAASLVSAGRLTGRCQCVQQREDGNEREDGTESEHEVANAEQSDGEQEENADDN